MSVLIKGMQMPKNCGECFVGDRTICHDRCPLVEVPTPVSDLIDRQAAIDAIRKSASDFSGFMEMEMYTVDDAITAVNTVPSAEPVRHGKWITEECLPGVAVCSICGHEIRGIGCQYTKYCDECGARMDKEDGRV